MQFTSKLLLTTLLCLTGARLAYCSQVQARLTASSTAATTLDEQKRKQALELLRQANELLAGTKDSAEQKQAVAQAVLQATGHEIVERDAKRVKLSAAEEKQKAEAQEKNWLLSYAKELSPEAEKKLEAAKIEAIKNERGTILPSILYDLLTCMPRELTNLIASYDEPYYLEGELDQTIKIPLPKDVTITAITPLLVPHGTIVVVGFSNGYVQIFKEQTDKEAKEGWALEQTIQADKSAVTTIADLKDQKFATGTTSGDLKIWTLKQNAKEYSCDATMVTGIPIKKIATLSNGNIVVGGTVGEQSGQWQIWDPVTLKKLYSCKVFDDWGRDYPFIDLLILPDDRIIVNKNYQDTAIYKQTKTNDWIEETVVKAPTYCQHLSSLHLLPIHNVLRCGALGDHTQIHILDHNNYDRYSLIFQTGDDEKCGPITILSDGKLAVGFDDKGYDDDINIFDISDTRYQLNLMNDNILAIPLSGYKSELQYLITLPDGRLLGAFKDGAISIWR